MIKRRRSKLGFEKLGPISSDYGGVIVDLGCSSPNRREVKMICGCRLLFDEEEDG